VAEPWFRRLTASLLSAAVITSDLTVLPIAFFEVPWPRTAWFVAVNAVGWSAYYFFALPRLHAGFQWLSAELALLQQRAEGAGRRAQGKPAPAWPADLSDEAVRDRLLAYRKQAGLYFRFQQAYWQLLVLVGGVGFCGQLLRWKPLPALAFGWLAVTGVLAAARWRRLASRMGSKLDQAEAAVIRAFQ
jgi:hypothetical protein